LCSTRALVHLDAVCTWAYAHLVDRRYGEWFGYADRSGTVTHRFKGGPYKGAFHVPRALLKVDAALTAALSRLPPPSPVADSMPFTGWRRA